MEIRSQHSKVKYHISSYIIIIKSNIIIPLDKTPKKAVKDEYAPKPSSENSRQLSVLNLQVYTTKA